MKRAHFGGLTALSCLALGAAFVAPAHATEPFPTRADRVAPPGRNIASDDSADALVTNPAGLANLAAREARWTYVRCEDNTRRVACGHAVDGAMPLPFGFGAGLRVDFVQPPGGAGGAGFPYDGVDYGWLTLGVGYSVSPRLSFGGTVQGSYSTNPYLNGLVGVSLGVDYRPSTRFGFAATLHDLNGPSPQKLPPLAAPILDRAYAAGVAFRPTGKRALELGLEARYYEGLDNFRPRATLGVDIPGVGRARGDVEMQNIGSDTRRGVMASAGLEVAFSGYGVGGGAIFGSGLGKSQSIAGYATASISKAVAPGVPRSERAVSIRVESTPGPRNHARMLRRLWKLAEDREVAAVMFVVRAEPSASFAHAEELADAFRVLKAHGKKVICSWEDAGPKGLYACASADKIVVNPAGGLRYSGLKTTHFYLAGMLAKLGVKAEFVKIGAHKLAPEQFANERASDVGRADQLDLLANTEAVFTENLVRYRKLTPEKIREATARGPFTAQEARDAGFADGFAFDDELERVVQDVLGRKVSLEKDEVETREPEVFGKRGKLGVLWVDGDMVDGRSQKIPLLGNSLVGSYTVAEAAKRLKDDGDVKAVVLRVETPGGSSMAADVMWREIKMLAEKKPVIVSMGSFAASGGYYIASASKPIYALPLTITGSIGIFYGKADTSELLKRIGVNVEVRKTTPRADTESLFRGFTDEERVELTRKIGQFYDVFLDRVASGRGMTKAQVDAVGQGRVWTGQQALDHKLVDRLGGLREAMAAARRAGHLPDDAPLTEAPIPEPTLIDRALELAGLRSASPAVFEAFPPQLKATVRAVAPFAIFEDGVPLARMDWMPLEVMGGSDD